MRTNWYLWSGVPRHPVISNPANPARKSWGEPIPTVVIDVTLDSWALPFALHLGGPLLGKPGFHFRILCVNIGWSKL